MDFNPAPVRVMHIDLNSCFATIEQQANPLLRSRPIAVAAYNSPGGCILAASVEAKALGVKTGMRVKEGRALCPRLHIVTPDPDKYRQVHRRLYRLFTDYAENPIPKSIDEFVLHPVSPNLPQVSREIKHRIKTEIGEWLTVSVGLAPNRFLAKLASSLQKPNGLVQIDQSNYRQVYSRLNLTDLSGIAARNKLRLNRFGIKNVLDFYHADLKLLKASFSSVMSYYWYLRLRGYEIDNVEFSRRSFGNSYALPSSDASLQELLPILSTLCEKTGQRLRHAGFTASGVHVSLTFRDYTFWHHGQKLPGQIFASSDIYQAAARVLQGSPRKKVHIIAVSVFSLAPAQSHQSEIFTDIPRKIKLTQAQDKINEAFGRLTLYPALLLKNRRQILDRIAFGHPDSI